MGVETADGTNSGKIGYFLVIARGRIIVGALIGAVIDMRFEGLTVGFQRAFIIGPAPLMRFSCMAAMIRLCVKF